MDLKQIVILLAQLSILCTVFGFGLKATTDDLLFLIRRPGLLIRSLAAMFVVMPIVAVILVRLFDFRPTVEVALVTLAISPVPPLLPQRQTKAGGQSAYAIGLMATLALVAVVLSPLAAGIVGWVFGSSEAIAAGAVARLALVTVLAPLVAGMVVRATMPSVAASIEKPVALMAKVLLPLAAVGLLVVAGPAMWALVGDGTLAAMILFQVIAFATGHLLAGPDPDRAIVLALSTACRHPAIAVTLAAATFPEQRFGAAILLYVLVAFITATPYLLWQRRQMRTMATGISEPAGR
jgi:bile acid:Na+ symporter, BASS family